MDYPVDIQSKIIIQRTYTRQALIWGVKCCVVETYPTDSFALGLRCLSIYIALLRIILFQRHSDTHNSERLSQSSRIRNQNHNKNRSKISKKIWRRNCWLLCCFVEWDTSKRHQCAWQYPLAICNLNYMSTGLSIMLIRAIRIAWMHWT